MEKTMSRIISFSLAVLLVRATSGQPGARAEFEAADVHLSPHTRNLQGMRGGYSPSGQYELHQATLVDLIRTAWNLDDSNRVVGGPAWLDDTRFDVLAKAPTSASPETAKVMLRALLADRFELVVHEGVAPLPGYVLTAGNRQPSIKLSASGEKGNGKCQNEPPPTNPGEVPFRAISCQNMTIQDLVGQLPSLAGDYFFHMPLVDRTGLQGAWDFALRWTPRGQLIAAGSSGISLLDAIDKQLGLRLDQGDVSMPVLIVDHAVEKPKDNPPDLDQKLPAPATEFEVAAIASSSPSATKNSRILPSGRVDLTAITLKELMMFAWNIDEDDMLAGPKWMETARFDVSAKAPAAATAPDETALRLMVRGLLTERFQIAVHYEDRPVTVYALMVAKPKLATADETRRTGCKFAALPSGSRSVLTRDFACHNISMEKFSERLRDLATDYIDHPVMDRTGLEGSWDFTFGFSPQASMRPGNDQSDPDGRLTVFEALETQLGLKLKLQRVSMPVLIVDQVQEHPKAN
jgi:uncharacterized protein (TIGR03435 family)